MKEGLILLAVLLIVAAPVNIICYLKLRKERKQIKQYWSDVAENMRELQGGE